MSAPLNFQTTFEPPRGVAEVVAPGVRRLVAENPSAMTFKGTNTYLLGTRPPFAVVDPGPCDMHHCRAIIAACAGEIAAIIVTHRHPDHVGGLADLVRESGAAVHAHCLTAHRDRHGLEQSVPRGEIYAGGQSIAVDRTVSDGQVIKGASGEWQIEAIHTPGHTPDHLAFKVMSDADAHGPVVLSGDHVMGWNTSVIAPPAGHMGDYYRSLEKIIALGPARYLPGHGDAIGEGLKVARAYLSHRRMREGAILGAIRNGASDARSIADQIYPGLAAAVVPFAVLSVLAHVEHLSETGAVTYDGPFSLEMNFSAV